MGEKPVIGNRGAPPHDKNRIRLGMISAAPYWLLHSGIATDIFAQFGCGRSGGAE